MYTKELILQSPYFKNLKESNPFLAIKKDSTEFKALLRDFQEIQEPLKLYFNYNKSRPTMAPNITLYKFTTNLWKNQHIEQISGTIQDLYNVLSKFSANVTYNIHNLFTFVNEKFLPSSILRKAREVYEKYIGQTFNNLKSKLVKITVKFGPIVTDLYNLTRNLLFCSCIMLVCYSIYRIVSVNERSFTVNEVYEEEQSLSRAIFMDSLGLSIKHTVEVLLSGALPFTQSRPKRYDDIEGDTSFVRSFFIKVGERLIHEATTVFAKFLALLIILPFVIIAIVFLASSVNKLSLKYDNIFVLALSNTLNSICRILRVDFVRD